MSEERRDESKQTHGMGEQYVLTPTRKGEKQKVKPQDELPQKVLTEGGALIDLDAGTINRSPRVTNLCGRNVDLSDFGTRGEGFITELYEQWLGSVQSGLVSTFCEDDEGHVNSAHILDYLGMKYEQAIKSKIVWRTEGDEIKRQHKGYLKWDVDSSFEDWIILTMATLRWRLKEEIDGRRFTQALRDEEIQMAKLFVGECLSVVERWLSLPDVKKLVSV